VVSLACADDDLPALDRDVLDPEVERFEPDP